MFILMCRIQCNDQAKYKINRYTRKCDWSPMSKYVEVVTDICGIILFSVNNKGYKNHQNGIENWYIVATFVHTSKLQIY